MALVGFLVFTMQNGSSRFSGFHYTKWLYDILHTFRYLIHPLSSQLSKFTLLKKMLLIMSSNFTGKLREFYYSK